MSTLKEFEGSTVSHKAFLLYRHAEFVMSIRYYAYKINLYLYQDVYFEVFYHHINDRIEKITKLDSESTRMKFYADQIRLPKIA
jgi:hypothetical protein